jgi:hypothetical protein
LKRRTSSNMTALSSATTSSPHPPPTVPNRCACPTASACVCALWLVVRANSPEPAAAVFSSFFPFSSGW